MRQFRQAVSGLIAAAALVAGISACGAPAYTYAADTTDHAYFKVPAGWLEVNPLELAVAQVNVLGGTPAGTTGGSFDWVRAYTPAVHPAPTDLLTMSRQPVVYMSVQNVSQTLRAELSFDLMRNLLFRVTLSSRQQAEAAGAKLPAFNLISDSTITTKDGMRGINELYQYQIGGQPDTFDQTVLTNSDTTKLYLLLVQCYQSCFLANRAQIAAVIHSFTVRGP